MSLYMVENSASYDWTRFYFSGALAGLWDFS